MSEPVSLSPSFGAVLTGMVYQAFPYTVLVLYPSVARLDPSLVEAARTLGASPIRAFFNLVVPTLRNALLATLIMVFVFALGSYLLPQLLGRPQHWTLSVLITDQAIYQSNMPFAAAMAVFLVLVSLALVGLSLLLGRRGAAGVTATAGAAALPGRRALPGGADRRRRRRLGECEEDAAVSRRRASRSPGTARSSPIRAGETRSSTSLIIAASAAALSVADRLPARLVAMAAAVAPGRGSFEVLGLTPFILPPVITALGFLSFWATVGFYGAPWTVVISHAIFFVTLPLVTLTLGFASIDREIVEAAATMGADDRAVLRTVILPLVRPYILSGYAFVFVLSLNEYIVAYMVVGFTIETLPIKIFNSLRYGYTPTMAAVTVVFVVVAALVFGLIARFGDLPRLLGAWAARED